MRGNAPLVHTRLPNEDDGGYLKFPALLVSDHVAFAIFDEHLEVHLIKSTIDPDEYDLIYASEPMMYVGSDAATVLEDIKNTPLVELARKYPLLCTASFMRPLKAFFDGNGGLIASDVDGHLTDVEILEEHGVTLEMLQVIADNVLR